MAQFFTTLTDVTYDAAARRFQARAICSQGAQRAVSVSAPGHPGWSFTRIAKALSEAAQRRSEVAK